MPYVNNDDALVPAYERLGIPTADARDYANSNCWETLIAGKSDQELIRGINFLLCLEWALNRGVTRTRGVREGLDTGDPLAFSTFDDLLDAWKRQIDRLISDNVDYIGSRYFTGESLPLGTRPLLVQSASLGLDEGLRRPRNRRHPGRRALRHLARHGRGRRQRHRRARRDPPAGLRRASRPARRGNSALADDWRGHEALRERMIYRAPKFANDDPAADGLGREMVAWFVERTRHHAARYPEIVFPCSIGTFSWYASIGVGPARPAMAASPASQSRRTSARRSAWT